MSPPQVPDHIEPGLQHFRFADYVPLTRWESYWQQLSRVLASSPADCLVVGKGDGIVTSLLEQQGVNVTTCDLVQELRPDVVGDVRALPFSSRTYDVVVCCQVLEHIPYEEALRALDELSRVMRKRLVLSLPNAGRTIGLRLDLGLRRSVQRRFPVASNRTWRYNGVHHWELGTTNYPTSGFRQELAARFTIEDDFRAPGFAYHHFFLLGPRA